jgi:competence protein ComEA
MKHRNHRLTTLAVIFALTLAATPAIAAEASQGVVNLNSATVVQLELLPGVGPALAQRIVAHREKNGSFRGIEGLMLVRGIGEKSFERIRPYISTSGATTLTEAVRTPRPSKPAKKKDE